MSYETKSSLTMQDDNATIRPTFPSSPQASAPVQRHSFTTKYPWRTIPTGESFIINYGEMKVENVRSFASRMAKKHGKKFRVIDHKKDSVIEVACIPMSQAEAVASSSNLIEALDKMKGK